MSPFRSCPSPATGVQVLQKLTCFLSTNLLGIYSGTCSKLLSELFGHAPRNRIHPHQYSPFALDPMVNHGRKSINATALRFRKGVEVNTRHWFSLMGTFLPFEITTYAI